ncbi:hypothetical protein D5046_24545 [Verminephrobacter eiseniae]|uniref:Ig-like domain-containing protein n=1 Tax=Verminephrobacter eiseniae TaxID=364317 RepID=UPI002AA2B521|nr:Ig-like domain-containing protein [Verminephrobacter eiseniae]MCW5234223.1 hypothetical protein [Verminephrobacter eiseniae]
MATTITIDRQFVKTGETAELKFTFTNPNYSLSLGSLTVRTEASTDTSIAGGTIHSLVNRGVINGQRVYTATFTPTANLNYSIYRIAYDVAGNADDAISDYFAVDTVRPTVASASIAKSDLRLGEKTTITITFSEPLTFSSFTLADLQVDAGKGTLSNLYRVYSPTVSSAIWQVDLQAPTTRPASGLDGNQIRINLAGITDKAGNTGENSVVNGVTTSWTNLPTVSYNIDNGVPTTVAITGQPATTIKGGDSFTVTFTFNERVTGFDLDDVQYDTSKGTLSALTAVGTDGKVWTATYTPRPNIESAENTIGVNLAGVRDAMDNAGVGTSSSGNFSIDTKPPEVAVTISDNRLTVGESATITFTFSERVTGFDLDDVQYDTSKGTLGALTPVGTDGKVWSASYTPRPGIESADNAISVRLAGVRDALGNAGVGTGTSGNFTIDTKPPEVTVTISDNRLTAGESATITFTFSERVTGFDLNDVQYDTSKGTLSALTVMGTDGRAWSATYTPNSGIESADNTIRVNLGGVLDVQGNAGAGTSSSGNFSIDTRPPEVDGRPSIVSVVGPTSIVLEDTDVTITFTFSKAVTGFTLANINLDNSSASPYITYSPKEPVSADGGRTWTITFRASPHVAGDSTNTVSIRNLDGVRDLAGNPAVPNSSASTENYEVDAVDPEAISATFDKTRLAAGETATVTVTFNEIVNNVTEDTFEIPNGSVSNLRQDPTDGRIWRATFTPTANLQSASSSISISLNGLRDIAGNSSNGRKTFYDSTIAIDTKRPEVTVAISDERLTAGETATVTFTFSERVTGFDLNDVQYDTSKGTLGALTAVGTDGKVWTATYTPRPDTESANNTIRVNLAGVQDVQGNAGTGTGSSGNFSIDTRPTVLDRPPEVTVTISDEHLTAGEIATVTFTFSESVTGFGTEDIQYDTSKGTLSALTAVGTDGKVWSATYTPNSGIESATNTIRVNLAGVQDAQGNAGTGTSSSGNFSIDTRPTVVDRPPEVTVTISDERLTAGETATVTFTFSESVTGFTKDDIDLTLANGTLGDLVPMGTDGKVWSATFTPRPNTESADNTIRVNLAGVQDAQGNAGAGTSTSGNFSIDTKPPEVAVTISDDRLSAGESATVTFTFSERVTGFGTEDIQYDTSKGTLSALTAVGTDGKVWTATYTPRPDTESATNTIRVNLAGVLDAQGNVGAGIGSSGNFVIDTRPTVVDRPPSATIAVTPNPVTNSNDRLVTVTITFDEAVTGFTADNIDFSNAHVTPYGRNRIGTLNSSADGRTYTITYTAEPDVEDATNTISLRNLHTIRDATGNAATVSPTSNNFAIDTKAPVPISATFDKTHLAVGETATVTVTFNEIVNNVTEDTFQIPNGSVSNLRQDTTDGRIWRATFTPTANLQSTSSSISISLDGLRDSAGNVNNGSLPFRESTITIDTKRPEATVAISDDRLSAGETATVTFTFTERVTGFGTEDIQYDTSKGTLGALTAVGTDGRVWTATYTPRPDTESATNTIRVNLAGVLDAQGNAGTGSASSGNFSIDTRPTVVDRPPEVTVTISDNHLTAGETATFTFTFTERVTGFGTEDIQYDTSKGTLSALTVVGTDGKVWTATYTPRPDIESANNTIRVNLSGVQDAQGNAGTGTGSSDNFSIDTKTTEGDRPPEVTVAISDERLTAGETATVTFTFSERVTGFTKDDIDLTLANGTLGDLVPVGTDGKVWSATFTPRPNTESANNTIRVNLAGVQDAQGNAGTGTGSSGNFVIDTRPTVVDRPPEVTVTISDERLTAGETATVTFTFSERVTGFGTEDIQYDTSKGTLSALTAVGTDGKVWTATYTPRPDTESANNTIRVNLAGVLDAQGNAGTGTGSSGNFVIDTRPTVVDRPPEVTVTISDERLTAGETATVTFTFSERVTGFGTEDIQYDTSKGTLSALTAVGTDGKVWTASYTPSSGIESANNTIRVNLAGVLDAQGNAGTGTGSSGNFVIDTRPTVVDRLPEVTVTISDEHLTAGETATVTFTFSESVTGFTKDDIDLTLANGTLGDLVPVGTDGRVWSATFTPRPNTESANNTIRVNLAGVLDAQGSAGTGSASSGNFSIDTKPPEVTVTISDDRLTAGESATVTFTFSERVTGFTKEAIDLSQANGTLGDLVPVGTDGKTWTATFTPTDRLARTTNHRLTLNLANVRDAAGNAPAANTYSFNQYTVDTMVFALSNATVNRNQLVLFYSDETALDPDQTHNAPGDAFVVLVNGVRNDVIGVAVDAAAKTITLTLANTVRRGQQVSVAYNDPSPGDDRQAVQEAGSGDDAASFAARLVTNLSPRAPATGTTDADRRKSSEDSDGDTANALDSDHDSVPNVQEDQAPGLLRPDGSAGPDGDGNGDDVQDSQQIAVGSTRDLTLVAGSQDGKLIPDSNARISELVRSEPPASQPKGMEMPLGLTQFRVGLSEGRSTESFSLYVDTALGVNGFWVKDSAGTWVNLASEPYGGKMSSEGGRTRLDFQIQDGGQYDADGLADGNITALGAAAKMPLSIVGQPQPQVESHGFWF